jgi:hypothetical protein
MRGGLARSRRERQASCSNREHHLSLKNKRLVAGIVAPEASNRQLRQSSKLQINAGLALYLRESPCLFANFERDSSMVGTGCKGKRAAQLK